MSPTCRGRAAAWGAAVLLGASCCCWEGVERQRALARDVACVERAHTAGGAAIPTCNHWHDGTVQRGGTVRLRAGSARALLRSRIGARARETSRTLESRGVTAPPNKEARCACVPAARARHGQVEAAHAPARHTGSRAPDAPPRRRPAGDGYAARGRCGAAQPSCAARRQACARARGWDERAPQCLSERAGAG